MTEPTLLFVRVCQGRQLGFLALWTASVVTLLFLWTFASDCVAAFAIVSCLFGGLSVLVVVEWFWLFPLRQVVSACHEIEEGHLDVVAPERGAREVKATARIINDMAADFQEVLLLTAHGSSEIRKAAEALESGLSRDFDSQRNLSEMLDLIRQTNEVIQEFKYFRVVVGKDSISDLGIVKATDSSTEGSGHGSLRVVGLDMACAPGSRKMGE